MNRIIISALAASILAIPAMAEDAPGYFKVPGTETTLKVYGFAETWGYYNMNQSTGATSDSAVLDQTTGLPVITLGHAAHDQSWAKKGTVDSVTYGRIGVTSTTPSEYGDVNVKVEIEGKSGGGKESWGSGFRLRHAYGEFGGLLIGQTNSLFVAWQYCPGYNDTWHEDFDGAQYRTRQARYTFSPTKEFKVAFSVEQDLSGGDSSRLGNSLVGAAQYAADWGSVQAAVGYQKKQDYSRVVGPVTTTKSGSGLSYNVGGSWNITSNDTIGARVIIGGSQNGNGTYDAADGFVTKVGSTNYSFYKSTSMDLGYAHTWNDKFTSNVGIGQISFPKKESYGYDYKTTISEFFVNTNWNITKNATFGLEYFNSTAKCGNGDAGKVIMKSDGTMTNKAKNDGFNVMFHYNFF